MNALNSAPFIRILPVFCLGICFSFYRVVDYATVFYLLCIGVVGLILFFSKFRPDFAFRCYTGFSFQFIFFVAGFAITEVKDDRLSDEHFSVFPESDYIIANVDNVPKGRNGRLRTAVSIVAMLTDKKFESAKGKCYLYFQNDSNAMRLNPGDQIVFKGIIKPIVPPLNPGQFDFKHWSAIHRVYHQSNIKASDWKWINPQSKFNLKSLSVNLRNRFLNTYKNAGLTGQEFAVLSALVLGFDDDIDTETMKAFSASGTLHVLSVSGMHVGIIFAALSAILTFLHRNRFMRIIRLLILLLALWFYALLTGLSPSVIRAGMMFSFIIIGKSLNRSSNIYNSLSLAALCIFILFDPLLLLEVGLQLSFLAVAGIAFLYPRIYKLFIFEIKLFDMIWALISVSIAAQAATFALSIYYFHQFPNYFIPANLLIIPLSTIGIFSGILLLFLNPFPFLCIKAGWLINQVIYLLNVSAEFIEDLPGSVWKGISISIFSLIVIYIILFAIVFFFEKKSIKYLYVILFSFCALLFSLIYNDYLRIKQRNLVIFSKTTAFCSQFNIGFDSFLIYHSIDSVLAYKYSNDYCNANGLPVMNRICINLDSTVNRSYGGKIFISDYYVLINKYLILDFSISKNSNNRIGNIKANLVYANKYTFNKIRKDKIRTDEIVINSRGIANSSESEFIKEGVKIHHLNRGAKIIQL